MPFVTINILEGKSKEYIQKVTDTINDAVIETMNFPEDDRYQVVHERHFIKNVLQIYMKRLG